MQATPSCVPSLPTSFPSSLPSSFSPSLHLRLTEALSVTIFVGFSVDYALHLAQAYRNAPFQDRHLKLRQGMLEVSQCTNVAKMLYKRIEINVARLRLRPRLRLRRPPPYARCGHSIPFHFTRLPLGP